ncbi:hypothetical protein HN592_05025 [Candidatus Woesearchaeota archaeon]|nr:hypothetical protein [Candidatus Woesearchaeota archaeon]MBT4367749.1 hypothetical protein [Candidatus Woesearchaeota archaeon]MBT4712237.1 hypothetical protein [Candidatus Woesearchaeota archaeon]MBT6638785.1 hypothetical protein [Candidatus Woesearchaeota archaeon]MBT7134429.1 hypothetical protein [Candidatus Woesearchaeota archaeon]
MKGQINALPFIIILSIIIIGALALFFYQKTSEVNTQVIGIEHNNFLRNIEKKITEYSNKNKGSTETFSFNIPEQINLVCFIDREGEVQKFSNPELDIQTNAEIDKNIFFQPKEFQSAKIENFEVEENPLCVKNVNSKINLRLESLGKKTKIRAASPEEIKQTECTSLIYNGEDKEKIDVAFIGYGYENNKKLTDDAMIYIENVFETIEPYASNQNKFNFYQINEPTEHCELTYYIKCNNFEVKKQASKCPNDFVIVLAERNKILNLASPIRSSAIGNLAKINTADNILVLAHEFGHSFGDLGDEYVDDAYYGQFNIKANEIPNCGEVNCKEWKDIEGSSCYKGCTLSTLYRATKNSIMNLYFKDGGETYGPVNEKELNDNLRLYK